MPTPEILVVSPPPIQKALGAMAAKFEAAEMKSSGLEAAIQAVAKKSNCHFYAAGEATSTSIVDGVHLDEDQHLALGKAMAERVGQLLK